MGPELSQDAVNIIDWVVVGLSGFLFLLSLLAAVYAAVFSVSPRGPVAQEFNYLWRARVISQLLAAAFALSLLLRLQVLWGPASVIVAGGYHPSVFCRTYVALAYGLFEPLFLLVAFFALHYSIQHNRALMRKAHATTQAHIDDATSDGRGSSRGGDALSEVDADGSTAGMGSSTHNPNFNILFLAVGFSLPCCAAQLVAALFTRIFDDLDYGTWLFGALFATAKSRSSYCMEVDPTISSLPPPSLLTPPSPFNSSDDFSNSNSSTALTVPDSQGNASGSSSSSNSLSTGDSVVDLDPSSNCNFCTFPLLSTLITGGFALCYLTLMLVLTHRICSALINKFLVRRMWSLYALVSCLLALSVVSRGVTVLFEPFELGFELLRLAHAVCAVVAVLGVSFVLVIKPVHDAHVADRAIRKQLPDFEYMHPRAMQPPSQQQQQPGQSGRQQPALSGSMGGIGSAGIGPGGIAVSLPPQLTGDSTGSPGSGLEPGHGLLVGKKSELLPLVNQSPRGKGEQGSP